MRNEHQYQLKIKQLSFEPGRRINSRVAKYYCQLIAPKECYHFSTKAIYNNHERHWILNGDQLRWLQPVPPSFYSNEVIEQIYKTLIKSLQFIWCRPVHVTKTGSFRINIGQLKMTRAQEKESFLIARYDLLSLYDAEWSYTWQSVEDRIKFDPEFSVQGLNKSEVYEAAQEIKRLFPQDWIMNRYKKISGISLPPMAIDIDPVESFPAYHIARTAIGALCKDPGWNYIVTLARAIKALRSDKGGRILIREIPSRSGAIYQALFSNHLKENGMLREVNQLTGKGNYKNDMLVEHDGVELDIEMKALSSDHPEKRLKSEIKKLKRRLPKSVNRPIVIYSVLIERKLLTKKDVKSYIDAITEEVFGDNEKVSAIVVGNMYVDTNGGNVKWSFEKFIQNGQAINKISNADLKKVFRDHLGKNLYPRFSMGLSFGITQETKA